MIRTTCCSTAPSRSATGPETHGPDYSHKHRRHGVNVQVVTDPTGHMLWISPALPGRAHDLTAARAHRIIRICERQGVPVLADRAYQGAGPWVTTGRQRPPGGELSPPQRAVNRALAQARAPVERGMARLKSWRIFRRSRISPNRMTSIAAAILTLERQRGKRSLIPALPCRDGSTHLYEQHPDTLLVQSRGHSLMPSALTVSGWAGPRSGVARLSRIRSLETMT
ncbi:transposase family protein [Streptomyces zaomyceticus]|uniref:HARBI1 family protein n=1 Tax=Streptomyces zaomyceticus TaxID=68286 RepID=UPI0035E09DC6